MEIRRINPHAKDLENLKAYCQLLGYEFKKVDGIISLKDPVSHKSVIVQIDHGKMIVVRDEAFSLSKFNDDIKTEEIVEDISDNIKLAKWLYPYYNSRLNTFIKNILEIKSLGILKIP